MDDTEKRTDRDMEFVTRHYRDGAFDVKAGWHKVECRLGLDKRRAWTVIMASRWRAAAAIAAGVVLTASACVLTWRLVTAPDPTVETPVVEAPAAGRVNAVAEVKRIEFTDAPLPEVIQAIERTYGVKVTNVPDTEYRLTLSYEGTAADLIATINDLLGVELKIEG